MWCLLWFDGQRAPVVGSVSDITNAWEVYYMQPDAYGPQIITCDIPKEFETKVPQAVSLQPQGDCAKMPKKPDNILRVLKIDRPEAYRNHSIGVCVQALRFANYEFSVRLVEWLEMMRMMAVDKVYMYKFETTKTMDAVLEHYRDEVCQLITLSVDSLTVCEGIWAKHSRHCFYISQ